MVKFIIKGECTSSTEADKTLNQIRKLMDPLYNMDSYHIDVNPTYNSVIGFKDGDKIQYTFEIKYSSDYEGKDQVFV